VRRIPFLPAALAALGLAGCDYGSGGPPERRYPLAVGDRLELAGRTEVHYYTPGVDHRFVADSTFLFELALEVAEAGTLAGAPALRCVETLVWEGGEPLERETYYADRDEGLWLLGYRDGYSLLLGGGSGRPAPPSPRGLAAALRGPLPPGPAAKGRAADDLVLYAAPRLVYAYPLDPGRLWTYQAAGDPFRVDRRVVSAGVADPGDGGGAREFVEIEWLFDADDDGAWDAGWEGTTVLDGDGLWRYEFARGDLELTDEDGEPEYAVDVAEQGWRLPAAAPLEQAGTRGRAVRAGEGR